MLPGFAVDVTMVWFDAWLIHRGFTTSFATSFANSISRP
jgi:hypothetical protein